MKKWIAFFSSAVMPAIFVTVLVTAVGAPRASEGADAEAALLAAARRARLAAMGLIFEPRVQRSADGSGWVEQARLQWSKVYFGTHPAGEERTELLLPIAAAGDQMPRVQFGDRRRILIVWPDTPGAAPVAVPYSATVWRRMLIALAPGWQWSAYGRALFRCPWCRSAKPPRDRGRCAACQRSAPLGSSKLCADCASAAGRCQTCERTITPAAAGVKLSAAPVDGEPGKVCVTATVPAGATAAELLVPAAEALEGCSSLVFLVTTSPLREPAVLLAKAADGKGGEPLTNTDASERTFTAEFEIDDPKGLLKTARSPEVRVAAGRLLSGPVKITPGGGDGDEDDPPVASKYTDGTYEGSGRGYRSTLRVAVRIRNGRITGVKVVSQNETPRYYARTARLPAEIVRKQGVEGVDAVSGATRSSNGILRAAREALEKAEKR